VINHSVNDRSNQNKPRVLTNTKGHDTRACDIYDRRSVGIRNGRFSGLRGVLNITNLLYLVVYLSNRTLRLHEASCVALA